ncbi:hypothetical protein ACFL2H_13420, partial [Planctomycetota bacterium]
VINCGEKRERRVLRLHAPFSIVRQGVPPGQDNDESSACNLRSGQALAHASGTQIHDLARATQPIRAVGGITDVVDLAKDPADTGIFGKIHYAYTATTPTPPLSFPTVLRAVET